MLINGSDNNAATSKYSLAPAFGNRRPGSKALYTGSLGAIVSNSVFDARPYSLTGLDIPKASYSRVAFVGTVGGPLNIPHLLPRGPNFFLAYQRTRDSDADTLSGLVPTVAERAGDLSASLNGAVLSDPITGLPLGNPVVVSPQAQALLQLYPLPNLVGNASYNYQTQVSTIIMPTHCSRASTKASAAATRFLAASAFAAPVQTTSTSSASATPPTRSASTATPIGHTASPIAF